MHCTPTHKWIDHQARTQQKEHSVQGSWACNFRMPPCNPDAMDFDELNHFQLPHCLSWLVDLLPLRLWLDHTVLLLDLLVYYWLLMLLRFDDVIWHVVHFNDHQIISSELLHKGKITGEVMGRRKHSRLGQGRLQNPSQAKTVPSKNGDTKQGQEHIPRKFSIVLTVAILIFYCSVSTELS